VKVDHKINLSEDYFDIGKIVNVHGLKGDIRIVPTTDDPSRFNLLDSIEIFFGSESSTYHLERAKPHKNVLVLKLKGIEDRKAAETLIGGIIKVPRAKALPLEDNEYYQKDLIDMSVISNVGEDLGTLVQVIETGANDVYVIRPESGKDLLIPAIKECILDVDVPGKKMTVHLMKGLREL
jgi:16S rRNA processing protein RimM